MTPMGEAMMARELGLDEQTAYDIEVEDNKPATDFNNNIRIWE
jgi:DNA-binding XRE family transcriptional regulator